MSDRRRPTDREATSAWIRDVADRLEKLENGTGLVGPVSLSSGITIGGIEITVLPTTGDGRKIVFTNPLTGATSTITL